MIGVHVWLSLSHHEAEGHGDQVTVAQDGNHGV